jgi:hypothetical protein
MKNLCCHYIILMTFAKMCCSLLYLNLQSLNDGSDDEDTLPSLKRPHLCCPPKMTVHHLCKVMYLKYLKSGTIMRFSYFSLPFQVLKVQD